MGWLWLWSALACAGSDDAYMGRPIAPTMTWHGAPWLVRDSRFEEERPDRLLDALGLEPGQTACDLGAGNGYHTLMLAERVGPEGTVWASDLQPEMLRLLEERRQGAARPPENVRAVLATPVDPNFPDGACDVVLMVDVYHELADPEPVLAALKRSLAPGGRVAIVEFRAEDPALPIKPEHQMTKRQVQRELEANGWTLDRAVDTLPAQHLLLFTPR